MFRFTIMAYRDNLVTPKSVFKKLKRCFYFFDYICLILLQVKYQETY